jgi:hypothetical protein
VEWLQLTIGPRIQLFLYRSGTENVCVKNTPIRSIVVPPEDPKAQLKPLLSDLKESLKRGNSRVEARWRNRLCKEVDRLLEELECFEEEMVKNPVYVRVKFSRKKAVKKPFRFIVIYQQ